jgi:hypothetical protein
MQQFDMLFIQTLKKIHIMTKNTKYIQFINSICYRQSQMDLTIAHLLYTNKFVQKHNENVFTNTLGPTFNFKVRTLITHHACHLTNSWMI